MLKEYGNVNVKYNKFIHNLFQDVIFYEDMMHVKDIV